MWSISPVPRKRGSVRERRRRTHRSLRSATKGAAYHWREYRIEELLPPAEKGRQVLLVGCGDGGERPYLRELGFETVGFDVRRTSAVDVLADAHQIPFENGSFDVVLSMQVLEHLHSPWIAVREIARVLRPGGCFVGSVAFLKPYHKSYFHMTHRGIRHLLAGADLEVDTFAGAQSLTYSLLGGLLPIGSRPFRRALLGAVDRLVAWIRVWAWSITRKEDPDKPTDRFGEARPLSFRAFDRLRWAPAIVFRARKISGD